MEDYEARKQAQIKELSDANRSATIRTACIQASVSFVGNLTRSERLEMSESINLNLFMINLAKVFEKYVRGEAIDYVVEEKKANKESTESN